MKFCRGAFLTSTKLFFENSKVAHKPIPGFGSLGEQHEQ
jgi:hypothetical protein